MDQALKYERINVNFITDEEMQILENIKSVAAARRMKLREYVIDTFRTVVGTEPINLTIDKPRKK